MLIPFVLDSGHTTNAVLAVRLNEPDTSFRFLYATGYRQLGYDTTDHIKWNARNMLHLFTTFDYSLFGHTRFRIRDNKLFKAPKDSLQVVLTLKPREEGRLMSGRQALLQVTECTYYMVCYIYTGGDGGGGMVRTTGNPYYYEDDCDFFALCTTYTTLGGGSGGDGGTGTGPGPGGNPGSGGTGGSGGSGGEWGGGNPCGGNAARTNREAPGGDCDPGWEPVDNGDNNYPDVNSIIDSLLSPCLKNTLHSMLLNNYTSQISSMLNTIWGATTDCNIRFLQTDTLPWGVDGITNTTISFGIMTQRVRLNQPVLDSASIEYVTTTMFHEVLHAYLNATGQYGNLKNHNTMANQYVNMLSSSLTEHFPSLDPVDVKALAWGGLHDTQAWDSIKVNHPVEYNDLRTRNARHRVHTAGTICK